MVARCCLTKSGTEGRNFQFCHRRRILICPGTRWRSNSGSAAFTESARIESWRSIIWCRREPPGAPARDFQEKLNLFDLIIGETGLILGDRFISEDFEEEIFRRWQNSEGDVAGALKTLGEELSHGRSNLEKIKRLDETLFAHDYESI